MARRRRPPAAARGSSAAPDSEPGGALYLRIRDEFIGMITSGKFKDGSRLPTVRALAKERSINPMTVARAYRELAQLGFVVARPGSGSFVNKAGRGSANGRPQPSAEPSIDPGGISSRLFELARAPGVIAF